MRKTLFALCMLAIGTTAFTIAQSNCIETNKDCQKETVAEKTNGKPIIKKEKSALSGKEIVILRLQQLEKSIFGMTYEERQKIKPLSKKDIIQGIIRRGLTVGFDLGLLAVIFAVTTTAAALFGALLSEEINQRLFSSSPQ